MGGVALITADHGNADKMVAEDGSPFTAHTTNPVPFCVVNYNCELREGGRLADIAPTMLQIMGLEQISKKWTAQALLSNLFYLLYTEPPMFYRWLFCVSTKL